MVDYRHINRPLEDFQFFEGFTKSNKFMSVFVLFLSLIVGCATNSSPITTKSHNEKPPVSANNSSAVRESHVDRPSVDNKSSKTLNCDDPKGYSVEEGTEPGTHSVNIVRDGRVLHSIKLLTDMERNGFGFDGVKKTKEGFELAIEYGTRIYYGKRFIFTCRHHKFYLSKIRVESFDRHNPRNGVGELSGCNPTYLLRSSRLLILCSKALSNPRSSPFYPTLKSDAR